MADDAVDAEPMTGLQVLHRIERLLAEATVELAGRLGGARHRRPLLDEGLLDSTDRVAALADVHRRAVVERLLEPRTALEPRRAQRLRFVTDRLSLHRDALHQQRGDGPVAGRALHGQRVARTDELADRMGAAADLGPTRREDEVAPDGLHRDGHVLRHCTPSHRPADDGRAAAMIATPGGRVNGTRFGAAPAPSTYE